MHSWQRGSSYSLERGLLLRYMLYAPYCIPPYRRDISAICHSLYLASLLLLLLLLQSSELRAASCELLLCSRLQDHLARALRSEWTLSVCLAPAI